MDAAAIRAALERLRRPGPPRIEVLDGIGGTPSSVGLVPGSFDPMTVAHAALADELHTNLTLFVYSAATLAKEAGPGGESTPPLLAPEDRVASLLSYCESRPGLGVALCSHGLYVDQAAAAAGAFPRARLLLGVGSDKLVQLVDPSWYVDRTRALDDLFSRAEVFYAAREVDEQRVAAALRLLDRWSPRLQPISLPAGVAAVSSRAVRDAVRRGADVSAMVPAEVLPFLRPAGA